MISASRFDALCLSLAGATVAPHFDRKAYRARKIFATLPPDGRSANLLLDGELQAAVVEAMPHAFAPVPGGWGRMGYTTVDLTRATEDELLPVLRESHALASEPRPKAPTKKAPTKKAPTKKAPTKKAPTKKAPTKKAPTKKAPAKKAPTKKVPKKKAAVSRRPG